MESSSYVSPGTDESLPGVPVPPTRVEQAASPLTAFLLAPFTELVVVPFMTDGAGAASIGGWFGTGADRAIALVFVVTGVLGLVGTLAALASRPYRRLSAAYLAAPGEAPIAVPCDPGGDGTARPDRPATAA